MPDIINVLSMIPFNSYTKQTIQKCQRRGNENQEPNQIPDTVRWPTGLDPSRRKPTDCASQRSKESQNQEKMEPGAGR